MNSDYFSELKKQKENLVHKYFGSIPGKLPVLKLLLVSELAVRQLSLLHEVIQDKNCFFSLSFEDYQKLLENLLLDLPLPLFEKQLRHFRHYHLLRLYLRELADLSNTEETTAEWSDCADAIILHALKYCKTQLQLRYGTPCDDSGEPVQLFIIAMGKLGGRELNFSSDIDLIAAYSAAGKTNGSKSISNHEFYTKQIQMFIKLLQTSTKDGFVFRVDLRLRPHGESGSLVTTLSALENYYQEQGRDWERYAMIKARLLNEPLQKAWNNWFLQLVKPFVYRRYIDFSVIESLRGIKEMIAREVQLDSMKNDIKRGRGGIREVEFIIQSFQLTRGGRIVKLQQANLSTAAQILKQEKLLTFVDGLTEGYWFLRKLENALQAHNDQQTHCLPIDELTRTQIAYALNFQCWNDLLMQLDQHRQGITRIFQQVLDKKDVYEDEKRLLTHQFKTIWEGHTESNLAVSLLKSFGYRDPEKCYNMIHAFRHGPRCKRLSQAARIRLDRFMLMLFDKLIGIEKTDVILLQVLRLLEKIVARSAYLALLTENPTVLHELLYWFEHSTFITSLLVDQPFLLEVLVDQKQNWQPTSKKALQESLQARLAESLDEEQRQECLRQFKLTCWLLAARSELYEQSDALEISHFLTDVAEILIHEVLNLSCKKISRRFPEIERIKNQFAVVAYGKLGGKEMNYDSDVDLVFLHTATPEEEPLVIRLTQKIIHMLTLRFQSGILYSVDTRLRPSGSSGLLVSHVDAFIEYQRNHAWTWEHQALIRARTVFADPAIHARFYQLKKELLTKTRDKKILRVEVFGMREKIRNNLNEDPVKNIPGGLLDLEFLVQYLVLAYPEKKIPPDTNTLLQLRGQLHLQTLTEVEFEKLEEAYRRYHCALHQQLLNTNGLNLSKAQSDVVRISKKFLAPSL